MNDVKELEIKIVTQKGIKYTLERYFIRNDEDYWQKAADLVAYYTYLFQTTPLYFLKLEGVSISTSVIERIYFEVHHVLIKSISKKAELLSNQFHNRC